MNIHAVAEAMHDSIVRLIALDQHSVLRGRIRLPTISLCMIVKNEEEVLDGCLSSVADLVDEIVIVDTGSDDRTKEIAAQFGAKIVDFVWRDHFADARNFAFDHATQEYILWLDADDELLEPDRLKLRALKESLPPSVDAVSMFYNTGFNSQGEVSFQFRRHRLVKRACNFRWFGAVHEYLQVGGNIFTTDIAISHRKFKKTATEPSGSVGRNLRIYQRMATEGREFTPRDLFYYGNELREHGQHEKALEIYEKFLATKQGWIEDEIRTCQHMADCKAALGNQEEAVLTSMRALLYDRPRPDASCTLGDHFMRKQKYAAAIYWYEQALYFEHRELPGFHHKSLTTWYPYLQLCVCHWQLGDKEASRSCNEKAASYHPEHPSIVSNQKLFEGSAT